MRIFVTGGTGFIGTHLVRELKKRKHKVVLLKARLHNIRAIERELKQFKPDVVVHLAWEGIPDLSAAMSTKNLINSVRFLELLGKLRIKKVIVTGTCYQHRGTVAGHDAFITAKDTLQTLGKEFVEGGDGVFVWTYPYFVYGPGKRSGSLIPFLINETRAGRTPSPKNPNAWHDFVYVEDVARALVLLAEKKIGSGSYDIGSGTLTRTGDIAIHIAKYYRFPPLKLKKIKKAGVYANLTALKKLGWKPWVDIQKGIRLTIAQYL